MTHNTLFLATILSVILSCSEKTGSKIDVSNETILEIEAQKQNLEAPDNFYDIINLVIKIDSIKPYGSERLRLLDSIPGSRYSYQVILDDTTLLKRFTKYDLVKPYLKEFFQKSEGVTSYSLLSDRLVGLEIVASDSIDFSKSIDENRLVKPFYVISAPIISDDEKLLVVSIELICFGLCGEGWTIFLYNQNGRWNRIGKILEPIG